MKQFLLICFLLLCTASFAQKKSFRFAFISDTHIGSPNGAAEEDLRRTVADVNTLKDIDFVVLTGDITELGTNAELALAKKLLDSLHIPYYIIPGNHDTGWRCMWALATTMCHLCLLKSKASCFRYKKRCSVLYRTIYTKNFVGL